MKMEGYIRAIAGLFILVSLGLGHWISPLLVPVHRFCGAEPAAVCIHRAVPHGSHPGKSVQNSKNLNNAAIIF